MGQIAKETNLGSWLPRIPFFSLALYIWRDLLGVHLLRTITLLVYLYFLSIFLYFLAVLGCRGNSGL
jgi:hypothetical protein